jgi:neutral ceramidase
MMLSLALLASLAVSAGEPTAYKAGAAARVITPTEPMWMSGYGNRTAPAEGKEHDLWVKALALEDAAGGRLVLLTGDLVGLTRELTEAVAADVKAKTGLPRERILFTCSHTHCGPVVRGNLDTMYNMPPELAARVGPYTDKLRGWMTAAILEAIGNLAPARLSVGQGETGFAVNRREVTPKGVINGTNPTGPVDHAVPVLKVESDKDGKLLAVVFGYACHNTTLSYQKWCGDYAGFAQIALQERHPGALAMFWIGCGGDANPLPRRTVELCRKYGTMLAGAVDAVLARPMTAVSGPFAARYDLVTVPLGKLPTHEQVAADALSKNHPVAARARLLLKQIEKDGKMADAYPHYPVQVWRLGGQVVWVALGGEVVIDYNLRLKKELAGGPPLWIAGYANDVMAYIPSARVLGEGGYEADSSMIYYGFPTKWAPAIEDRIVAKVHELVKASGGR